MKIDYYFENEYSKKTIDNTVEIVKKVLDMVFNTNNFLLPQKYSVTIYDTDIVSDKNFVFTFDYEFKEDTTLKTMKIFNRLVIDFLTLSGIEIVPDLDSTLDNPILDCYF